MNWKELYALVNEIIKNAVSGLYKPAGDVTFAELPELSQSVLGYTYTVTDAFTTDSRFTDYDAEAQTGHSFPADTEVAVIVTGTTENPVYMFNVMGGIMDGYATKGDLDNYVEKEAGKSLSTNDYTDADKALVQDSPITVTATGSDLTLSTSAGSVNALTVYGKSEVVNNEIISAGEGYAVVRLADLTWNSMFDATSGKIFYFTVQSSLVNKAIGSAAMICAKYRTVSPDRDALRQYNKAIAPYNSSTSMVAVRDDDYATLADFVASLGDATLCYEEATPTNNTIAVKTDNGSGISGTMATFTTGTPLRGIPETTVRDVMEWDGSAGAVTKNCAKVRLAGLTWMMGRAGGFATDISNSKTGRMSLICTLYPYDSSVNFGWGFFDDYPNKKCYRNDNNTTLYIKDTDCTTVEDFVASLGDAELVYELTTPTTQNLTSIENASLASLRTFTPQTHIQNNAGAEMTVEAYAGTANGQAVANLKQDVQSEISALKITQSDTLTLTVAGWSNNAQTVTYAHDTTKRNVIDVDPASVEEWASCGVLATAETASGITFSCKTVPENALTFRVTSMGVN